MLHKQPKDIFSALMCSATSLTSVQTYIHLSETEPNKKLNSNTLFIQLIRSV